jgi:hypothetical protein
MDLPESHIPRQWFHFRILEFGLGCCIREKASVIKELFIKDFRNRNADNNDEPKVLPDLLDTLAAADRVTPVNITCRLGGTVPLRL